MQRQMGMNAPLIFLWPVPEVLDKAILYNI